MGYNSEWRILPSVYSLRSNVAFLFIYFFSSLLMHVPYLEADKTKAVSEGLDDITRVDLVCF